MSVFRDRIASLGQVNPDLSVVGRNDAPMTHPLVRIAIYPGVITYEDLQPLITSDGAPVAATSKGEWGQLYAAGRM